MTRQRGCHHYEEIARRLREKTGPLVMFDESNGWHLDLSCDVMTERYWLGDKGVLIRSLKMVKGDNQPVSEKIHLERA
jgi:hypothetical protein